MGDSGELTGTNGHGWDVDEFIAWPEPESEDSGDSEHGNRREQHAHPTSPVQPPHEIAVEEENHQLSLGFAYPSPPATQSQEPSEQVTRVKKERRAHARPRAPSPRRIIRTSTARPTRQPTMQEAFAAQDAATDRRKKIIYKEWLQYEGDNDPAEFKENKKPKMKPAEGSRDNRSGKKSPYARVMNVRTSSRPNQSWVIHHGKQKVRMTPLNGHAHPLPEVQVRSNKTP